MSLSDDINERFINTVELLYFFQNIGFIKALHTYTNILLLCDTKEVMTAFHGHIMISVLIKTPSAVIQTLFILKLSLNLKLVTRKKGGVVTYTGFGGFSLSFYPHEDIWIKHKNNHTYTHS